MIPVEGEIIEIYGHELISYGYVNPTPWNTHREKDESSLFSSLKQMTDKLSNPQKAILNFHAPPFGTALDNALLLDKNLKPVVRGGEIVMTHVGSTSVRKIIEEYKPLLTLHGHIHESRGFQKIGGTLSINPGSEFSSGILNAAYVVLESDRVKAHQFLTG